MAVTAVARNGTQTVLQFGTNESNVKQQNEFGFSPRFRSFTTTCAWIALLTRRDTTAVSSGRTFVG